MFKRILRGSYQFLHHSQVKPGQIIFYTKTGKHYKIQAKDWSLHRGDVLFGTVAFGRNAGQLLCLTDSPHEADSYFYEQNGRLHWSNIPPSPGDVIYVHGQRAMVVEYVTTDMEDSPHRPPYYIIEDDYCHRHTFFGNWRRDIRQVFYPVLERRV